ncbi:histone deacetylase family protein [Conchiformibius steedae DSM 2580]|uniref:Histone deacetylase family protein n=1 Tax=Conchiformibius steedae DSM 2580 TaxID=1121352 RepID=A0AAE9HW72_9NEIS|nr:histone deacetylase family protein [Conchiformibius steedae]URD67646.1 histone deacetylase family protein [Conchiformibius steedae DSM 2580]
MKPLRLPPRLMRLFLLPVRYLRFFKRRLLRAVGYRGRTAWVSSPHCLAAFTDALHPEQPERITVIEQALKKSPLWARLQKTDAPEVSDIQLARVHSRRYLADLENRLPTDNGVVKINEDTYLAHNTLNAARYAAGAVVKAVDMVMRKHAKNAFCAVRPPGHHAAADQASGFCFINNIAVGVMHAVAEYRLKRIAVIDFDLHHGDGTENIFAGDPRVLMLSSFEFPLYPFNGSETDAVRGDRHHIFNYPLQAGDGSAAFRYLVRAQWLPKLASFNPQMIFLSAGFDAHRDDDIGHLCLTEADFAWLTRKIVLIAERHAQGRIVSVLEGGYYLPSLAASAKAHIGALIQARGFKKWL